MRWWYTKQEPSGPIGPPRRPEPVSCAVAGCDRRAKCEQFCDPHYRRNLRNGDPGPAEIKPKAANGQGKNRYISNGYVFLRKSTHPNAYKNGVVMEHTVVMSDILGRPLLPGENVHHKNGNRTDNRPSNLELWSTHQPKGQGVADKVAWAREILDLYGDLPPEVLG